RDLSPTRHVSRGTGGRGGFATEESPMPDNAPPPAPHPLGDGLRDRVRVGETSGTLFDAGRTGEVVWVSRTSGGAWPTPITSGWRAVSPVLPARSALSLDRPTWKRKRVARHRNPATAEVVANRGPS